MLNQEFTAFDQNTDFITTFGFTVCNVVVIFLPERSALYKSQSNLAHLLLLVLVAD